MPSPSVSATLCSLMMDLPSSLVPLGLEQNWMVKVPSWVL